VSWGTVCCTICTSPPSRKTGTSTCNGSHEAHDRNWSSSGQFGAWCQRFYGPDARVHDMLLTKKLSMLYAVHEEKHCSASRTALLCCAYCRFVAPSLMNLPAVM
jgi:hypothetical protein